MLALLQQTKIKSKDAKYLRERKTNCVVVWRSFVSTTKKQNRDNPTLNSAMKRTYDYTSIVALFYAIP